MNNNKRSKIIVCIAIIVSIILGLSSLYTPRAKDEDNGGFSTENSKKDIKVISQDVHSVRDQDNLAKVRQYLVERLEELGLDPQIFTYENITDKYDYTYDVNNIYAQIDGKNGEDGNYIMLATHYDSSPKKRAGEDGDSKGAADAGYGISTILEIVRIIQENNLPLENGIKILITDAEETGLLGAKNEMDNNFDLYENVSFVINLEARGIKGPAIMFETSDNNSKVIELFKEANLPVSYSLAADVYRKMPNGSDFTEFLGRDMNGINLAVLDSLDYYHTKLDNYDNISDTSIQHYGEQVLPIVEEFVYSSEYSDKSYFDSDENSIFFTFLPNVMISYSNTWGIIFTVLAIVLFVLAIIFVKRNDYFVKVKNIFAIIISCAGLSILATLLGVGISYILSKIYDMKFSLTYMPKIPIANILVLVVILIVSALVYILFNRLVTTRGLNIRNLLFGGIGLNVILLVVFMIALPGGSYLFLFPVALGSLALILENATNKASLLLPIVFSIIMYVPLLYILNIALTIGALGILLLLYMTMLSVVVPCILIYTHN